MPTADANFPLREIREPYPGLRPFLDHEHALLKGRDDQIVEIVKRLDKTHFVAIIGGSGSGKSSLIRAGVVSSLRTQSIPAAGDYWIPIVFTPGTTKGADPGDATAVETPTSRLAWKFAQALRAPGIKQADLALRDEVTAFLRQGAGFSRLVAAYHQLLPRQCPPSQRARFLFVIDQFEELFHPNNRDSADARTIVEAVIAHFLEPDERTFVVMTMRSEHLADCAAYLRLPDAINRSFYLVRRLNSSELRQVIIEPAQVMVRRVQRSNPCLIEPVVFAPEVVARILADVRRCEDDPDHLPLLQHLLARTWSAALDREHLPSQGAVPAQVTMADLEAAVAPGDTKASGWLNDDRNTNTLRSSLENWAEHIYLDERTEPQRSHIDVLLRHLAFKDPNNGLYFQQRVDVDDLKVLAGVEKPRELLLALLERGFLDTVNYLFWDDENPAHVTLKVSHEAFIRGWSRFRRLVDSDAERFDEFVAVARRCLVWLEDGRSDGLLLESSELVRITGANLDPVFYEAANLQEWFNVLRLYREGDRLAAVEAELSRFMAASRGRQLRLAEAAQQKEKEIQAAKEAQRKLEEEARIAVADRIASEARERQLEAESAQAIAEAERAKEVGRRTSLIIRGAVAFAVVLMVVAAYAFLFQWPAMWSVDKFLDARIAAEARVESERSGVEKAAEAELRSLVSAAELVSKAREGVRLPLYLGRAGDWRKAFDYFPLVRDNQRQFEKASNSTEPFVNDALRRLLTTAVWDGGTKSAEPVLPIRDRSDADCELVGNESAKTQNGSLLLGDEPGHGFFVPRPAPDTDLVLYDALVGVGGSGCKAYRVAFQISGSLAPTLLFDARLVLMAVFAGTGSENDNLRGLTLFDIDWSWDPSTSRMTSRIRQRRVVTDPRASNSASGLADTSQPRVWKVTIVPTSRTRGGILATVGGQQWYMLSSDAQPIGDAAMEEGWRPLNLAKEGTPCYTLGKRAETQRVKENNSVPVASRSRLKMETLEDLAQTNCVFITRFDVEAARPVERTQNPTPRSEIVSVRVFHTSAMEALLLGDDPKDESIPTPVAAWKFDRQAPGQERDWWVGNVGGKWDGWLAATAKGSRTDAVASPFSTEALKSIAKGILGETTSPDGTTTLAQRAASATGR